MIKVNVAVMGTSSFFPCLSREYASTVILDQVAFDFWDLRPFRNECQGYIRKSPKLAEGI